MVRRVHCEKKTKVYIPKVNNPQILICHRAENEMRAGNGAVMAVSEEKFLSEKRR